MRWALLCLVPLLWGLPLVAQEIYDAPIEGQRDICTEITSRTTAGSVSISQPDWIRQLLGRSSRTHSLGSTTWGYRIQIYTGNMRDAKKEVYARAQVIKQHAPELPYYIKYQSPFWSLTVGNYLSREEAQQALTILKSRFPSMCRESYIVREKVHVH